MLAKILNLPWSRVHEEAHKIEHSISNEVEKSLIEKLENPDLCPHGNPMPGSESISNHWDPLVDTKTGIQVTIKRIHEFLEDDPVLMKFLESHQVLPGNLAKVIEILPFNKTITLEVNSQPVTLGFDIAKRIFVETINKEQT